MNYIILTFTHGSVCAVVDGDTGTVIEANGYYPFGKRIPSPVAGAIPVAEPVEVTESLEVTKGSSQDTITPEKRSPSQPEFFTLQKFLG